MQKESYLTESNLEEISQTVGEAIADINARYNIFRNFLIVGDNYIWAAKININNLVIHYIYNDCASFTEFLYDPDFLDAEDINIICMSQSILEKLNLKNLVKEGSNIGLDDRSGKIIHLYMPSNLKDLRLGGLEFRVYDPALFKTSTTKRFKNP